MIYDRNTKSNAEQQQHIKKKCNEHLDYSDNVGKYSWIVASHSAFGRADKY